MMKIRHSMALLLLAGAIMSSLAMQTSTAGHGSRPIGGCHDPGKKVPAPKHADYACCVAGHGVAMVQTSDVRRIPLQVRLNMVPTTPPQGVATYRNEKVSAVSPGSPPSLISLRI
jgi:hypothetical protein